MGQGYFNARKRCSAFCSYIFTGEGPLRWERETVSEEETERTELVVTLLSGLSAPWRDSASLIVTNSGTRSKAGEAAAGDKSNHKPNANANAK